MEDHQEVGWPGLFTRYAQVLVSPGELFRTMPERPPWAGAFFLTSVLIALSFAPIPVEVFEETARQKLLEAGQSSGNMLSGNVIKALTMGPVMIVMPLMMLILAGFTTVWFCFIMGDEGTYRKHLSIVSHTGAITALGAFVAIPLRIMNQNLEMTLSMGTLLPFLPDGMLYNILSAIDLFGVWACFVVGIGVAALSKKRDWVGAAMPLLFLMLALAVVTGYCRT